jgi:hypothetical protein
MFLSSPTTPGRELQRAFGRRRIAYRAYNQLVIDNDEDNGVHLGFTVLMAGRDSKWASDGLFGGNSDRESALRMRRREDGQLETMVR